MTECLKCGRAHCICQDAPVSQPSPAHKCSFAADGYCIDCDAKEPSPARSDRVEVERATIYQVKSFITPGGWIDCTQAAYEDYCKQGYETRMVFADQASQPERQIESAPSSRSTDLDKLEAKARKGEYITRVEQLELIALARRAIQQKG